MINKVDHLIVAVKDLSEAEESFSILFGSRPVWRGEHPELGTINSIFNFDNIYFELLASNGEGLGAQFIEQTIENDGEGLAGIVLGTNNLESLRENILSNGYELGTISRGHAEDTENGSTRGWQNLFLPEELTRGLFSFLIQHDQGSLPHNENISDSSIGKLDHVVINTNDPEGLIEVYRDTFGIRLALDQTVEKWGGRMLFFRLNKTTIEVIAKEDDQKPRDSLWGMAWEVKNIEKTHKRLSEAGVILTDIKDGRKPNTLVTTVKSHTINIPTLLIEHLSS